MTPTERDTALARLREAFPESAGWLEHKVALSESLNAWHASVITRTKNSSRATFYATAWGNPATAAVDALLKARDEAFPAQAVRRRHFAVAVWFGDGIIEKMEARSADGRYRLTYALGDPDEQGICNLLVTRHDDPLPAVADRDALLALVPVLRDLWADATGSRKSCGHEATCTCTGDRYRVALAALPPHLRKEVQS